MAEGCINTAQIYKVLKPLVFVNEKINIHQPNSDVESRLRYIQKWNIPSSVIKDLTDFLNALGSGKVNKGIQVSKRTQVKYLSLLKAPLTYLKKDLKKITKKDIEKFDSELSKDLLNSEKGKPFSYNMKKDMRIALRVLLKWKLGEPKMQEMTDFFDTRDIKKTPDYLKEKEIELMFKACKSNAERYCIAVLFDSGARAEEFMNIRYEDVHLPEGKESYVRIALKKEYSKTEGRTISLYWYKSLEAVQDFVRERMNEGIKSNEPIMNLTYDSLRFFVMRLGNKVLHKPIHFHLFRHSSATHYARKMNRQELCYRYGWKFSSDMPDVYISRAGVESKELDEKFSATEIKELKEEIEKLKFEHNKKIDMIKLHMENNLKGIKKYLESQGIKFDSNGDITNKAYE